MTLRISVLPALYQAGMVIVPYSHTPIYSAVETVKNLAELKRRVEALRAEYDGQYDAKILLHTPIDRAVSGFVAYRQSFPACLHMAQLAA